MDSSIFNQPFIQSTVPVIAVETVESVGTYSRPSSAWPLDWPLPSTPSTGSRPTSATESASRPGSADSYRVSVDDTSFLTHG